MKLFTLHQYPSNHQFSSAVEDFWNNKIVPLHNSLNTFSKVENWQPFLHHAMANHLFVTIEKTFALEKKNQHKSNISENNFYSIQFLNLLKNENFDFTTILQNTLLDDPKNLSGWQYDLLLPIYSSWLKSTNQNIPNNLLDNFLNYQENKQNSFADQNKLISSYFNIIDIMENKNISYSWFKKNLDSFAYFSFDNSFNDIDPLTYDVSNHLDYGTQIKIFNFIQEKFPDYLEDNSKYYPHFFIKDSFKTETFFETCIQLNLFKFAFEHNIKLVEPSYLKSLINHCLFLISSPEFKENIDPTISLVSSNITQQSKTPSVFTIYASTRTLEQKQSFQEVFIPVITSILKDSDKFYISYDENFSGPPDINTNLTLDVFSKYYLHSKFNSTIDSNSTSSKKIKI